jgi:hypothetical protein
LDNPPRSSDVERLYAQFSDCFGVKDDEAVRRIYRELLRMGRPRAEILEHAVRLASDSGDFAKFGPDERLSKRKEVETVDRIAEAEIIRDAPADDPLANGTTCCFSQPGEAESRNLVEPAAEYAHGWSPERASEGSPNESTPGRTSGLPLWVQPPSVRLSIAIGGLVVASVIAFVLPPARSTAEKASAVQISLRAPPSSVSPSSVSAPIPASETARPASSVAEENGPASPLSSNETAANRAPEARSAEAQQQTAAASPATLGALTPSDVPAALNGSRLSAADLELLLTRGDTLFASGDLTSARLFYERAAQAGNGPAALRLAETYDPQFLKRAHLRGVQGDIATATFWYKRASNLGMSEAGILLGGLPSK